MQTDDLQIFKQTAVKTNVGKASVTCDIDASTAAKLGVALAIEIEPMSNLELLAAALPAHADKILALASKPKRSAARKSKREEHVASGGGFLSIQLDVESQKTVDFLLGKTGQNKTEIVVLALEIFKRYLEDSDVCDSKNPET